MAPCDLLAYSVEQIVMCHPKIINNITDQEVRALVLYVPHRQTKNAVCLVFCLERISVCLQFVILETNY